MEVAGRPSACEMDAGNTASPEEAMKALMMKTKKHVQEMMAGGKMFGQPFSHVMFGNARYTVTHP